MSLRKIYVTNFAVFSLLLPLAPPSFAAGTEDGSYQSTVTAVPGSYAEAKKLISEANYSEARTMLQGITSAEPSNADAWNLLGFSSRKLGDLTAASKAYSQALKLNPGHLGALEYQGEMYIQMGDSTKAKANLVTLQGLCGNCEEMRDLQKALTAAGIY
ncbi:MAG: tetratricopeptide repeat protein [Pseudotabrizicola sp.]|uniref:tetratricopeptide repeat protein n=1 Tax=Pseudotabrizicola sp. TaxID=2939647 RepID=UPI00272F7ABD|nr:tetratricopeptide repeat protein [Pseudotabrizicola sp.]MDP2083540.1 tetratricopeptide repeat protein [Pseudotabrizicola sp.]MDZ7574862.1 tetratricopeptide repeat protein [Pseudotabrizicola sp.]